MFSDSYLHGYSRAEQIRLVRQADYWRKILIPLGLDYRPGERVLEIGCGAGATLAVLARDFPGLEAAGVDIEPAQVQFARQYFASLGLPQPDLRAADGCALPWPDQSFDHVYIMWLIEHLKDAAPVLDEAHRVLRPGGSITVTETDYTTFKVLPASADWELVERAQYRYFERYGNPQAGRQLGGLLRGSGFSGVANTPVGFHYFFDGGDRLQRHAEYVANIIEPSVAKFAGMGFEQRRLEAGLSWLRSIGRRPDGSMTTIVYRAKARR